MSIEFNKISADLEFVGKSIKHLAVENQYINTDDHHGQAAFAMDLRVTKVGIDNNADPSKKFGQILLFVEVDFQRKNDEKPGMNIKYCSEGCFSAPKDIDEQIFVNMLYINGGSTLYSIARADILDITAKVFHNGKIALPMINFVQFMEEKSKELDEVTDTEKS